VRRSRREQEGRERVAENVETIDRSEKKEETMKGRRGSKKKVRLKQIHPGGEGSPGRKIKNKKVRDYAERVRGAA